MTTGETHESPPGVEVVRDGDHLLAYIISSAATSTRTSFITSDEAAFQAGFVVYSEGSQIDAHVHLPVTREIVGTSEMLLVRSGHCIVDIYSADRRLVRSRELFPGDGVLTLAGGHGFRMLEPTVLFEIKQGPYGGQREKERFVTGGDGQPL